MRGSWVATLAFTAMAPPPAVAVYHFVDGKGVEHYVDQLDRVPAGIHAEKVDLAPVPLNPEVEKELERSAAKAREQAKPAEERSPWARSRPLLLWSLAMAALCLILTLVLRGMENASAGLIGVFQFLRFAAGVLAFSGAGFWAYQARDGLAPAVDRFPPFAALKRAQTAHDEIEKRQREQQEELQKVLDAK